MRDGDSALVVLVPEAEPLLRPFRTRYDPSAADGMPAHVTVLYPFKPLLEIDEATLAALRRCVSGTAAFDFALTEMRRFPDGAVYLAVEPAEPYRRLTLAIWRCFPGVPPYGGRYAEIVPHLTVARGLDTAALAAIARDFGAASAGKLPIAARAAEVALMETRTGRWQVRATFPLG